jgi:xanthine/uracil permease
VFALVLSSDGRADFDTTAVLAVLAGWSFIASGLIAWKYRPEGRLGPIMAGVGLAWLASRLLVLTDSAPVHTGIWLGDLWVVIFAFFLVSFPQGRLLSKRDYALIAPFFIAVVPLELLWLLFWETEEGPENPLLAWLNADVAADVDAVQRALISAGSLVLTGVLAQRWLAASPAIRRVLTPLLVGAVAILLGTSIIIAFASSWAYELLVVALLNPPLLPWAVPAIFALFLVAVTGGRLGFRKPSERVRSRPEFVPGVQERVGT